MLLAQFPSMHDFPQFFPRLACFSKASRQLTSTSRTCPTLDQVPGKTNWEPPNWRPHIFQRGADTTNQSLFNHYLIISWTLTLSDSQSCQPQIFLNTGWKWGPDPRPRKNLGVIMLRDGTVANQWHKPRVMNFYSWHYCSSIHFFVFQFQVSISLNFSIAVLVKWPLVQNRAWIELRFLWTHQGNHNFLVINAQRICLKIR